MALLEMTFAANTLERWTEATVILPVESAGPVPVQKPEKFPTLYLLHGYSGNSKDWLTYSNIRGLAEAHNLAVVMPSGENGFYVDNPEFSLHYGQFIRELVDFTRKMFPLSDKREDTFIAGLSMGGFGAMRNGFANNDLFGKIGALSGAYILEDIIGLKEGERSGIADYGYYRRVFGDLQTVMESDSNPLVCAANAKSTGTLPDVFMACGTEDFVIENNRRMRDGLEKLGIPFQYHEGPGIHDWKFWGEWLPKLVDWLMEVK